MNSWGKILALIAVALTLTLGVVASFSVPAAHTVAELEAVTRTERERFKDAWEIPWLDAVLTAAAARSSQSGGDPVWQQRDNAHVVLLDAALASAKQTAAPGPPRRLPSSSG